MTVADLQPSLPPVNAPDPYSPPAARRRLLGDAAPSHLATAALLYVFFGVFLLWPILNVVQSGFRAPGGGLTLRYIGLIFQDVTLVRGLFNAVGIAVATTALTFVMALPLAILSNRFEFPGRGILGGLLLVPLVLPPFVGAVGLRTVLGTYGPLTTLLTYVGFDLPLGVDWLGSARVPSIILVEALHLYPIMLLNVQAALANIDPAMEQAARNLGATRPTIFRRITLPLIRPGLFAGATLVLIWSFTELGTPLIFQFNEITPVQVFRRIPDAQTSPTPFALVVVMLVASVLLYVVGKLLLGRGFDAATTKASTAATTRKLTGWKGLLAALPFLLVFGLAVIPHLAVIFTSFSGTAQWYQSLLPREFTLGHYRTALIEPSVIGSVWNSLFYAVFATAVAVVVGLAAAVVVVRSRVPGRGVIDSLAMLPLAVPGLVLAFGYLSISLSFVRWFPEQTKAGGSLSWLNVLENPTVLLIVAYAARRLPYVARSAVAGLQQTPRDLELAASNLGATKATVLRRITLPLILANLLAGGLLAFAFAMLEVSDSLILAQQQAYYPITKQMYDLSGKLGDGLYVASALGVWTMILLTLTILSANALLAKKMGAIFRV